MSPDDRQLVLIRLCFQFTIACTFVALAAYLYSRGQGDQGAFIAGAVLAAWVNEGIHAGRAASKTADTSTMTITGEATVTAPTPPDGGA